MTLNLTRNLKTDVILYRSNIFLPQVLPLYSLMPRPLFIVSPKVGLMASKYLLANAHTMLLIRGLAGSLRMKHLHKTEAPAFMSQLLSVIFIDSKYIYEVFSQMQADFAPVAGCHEVAGCHV